MDDRINNNNKFSVSLIIWMLLFFVTGTLGYLDLEVTIFRNLLSSKHAALKKRIFPNVVKRRRPLNISYGTWYWRASGIKFPLRYWNVDRHFFAKVILLTRNINCWLDFYKSQFSQKNIFLTRNIDCVPFFND